MATRQLVVTLQSAILKPSFKSTVSRIEYDYSKHYYLLNFHVQFDVFHKSTLHPLPMQLLESPYFDIALAFQLPVHENQGDIKI